ncbi:MAG: CDP-archaeol synthase [Candidatus Aenigmarchaeota archaeon]|nr:CDP-archaeol synthase [Candidatus Aenigmarchaeota archaeon]
MNLKYFLDAIWFILPLYIANMTPSFVKKINFLNYPIDFGKSLKGQRILGDHKTWRGLVLGTLMGGIFALIQRRQFFVGLIMTLGGFTGDSIGSFIKRRRKIKEGGKFFPIDQIDFALVSLLFCKLFNILTIDTIQVIFLLILTIPLSYLASMIGYKLKLKGVPW